MIVASLLVFAVNLPLFSCACHLWVVSVFEVVVRLFMLFCVPLFHHVHCFFIRDCCSFVSFIMCFFFAVFDSILCYVDDIGCVSLLLIRDLFVIVVLLFCFVVFLLCVLIMCSFSSFVCL